MVQKKCFNIFVREPNLASGLITICCKTQGKSESCKSSIKIAYNLPGLQCIGNMAYEAVTKGNLESN